MAFFGFLNFFILIRYLPTDEFGEWQVFIVVTTILEGLVSELLRNPLIVFTSGESRNNHGIISTASITLGYMATFILIALMVLGGPWLSQTLNVEELPEMIQVHIVYMIIYVLFNYFENYQQGQMKFMGIFLSHMVVGLVFFLGLLVVVFGDYQVGLVDLVKMRVGALAIAAVVSYLVCRGFLPRPGKLKLEWLRKLFDFGKYTFGTNMAALLFRSADQLMLSNMLSPRAVAIYNPAIRITNLVEIPTLSLSMVLTPRVARQSSGSDANQIRDSYEKSTGIGLAILLPIMLTTVILANFIVDIIAGSGYSETVPILRITIYYSMLLPLVRFFGNVLDGSNKPHLNFFYVSFLVVLNVVLNYVLITHFQLRGAAFATFLTILTGAAIALIYMRKQYDVKLSRILSYSLNFYKFALSSLRNWV